MAAKSVELLEVCHGQLEPLHKFECSNVSEVPGRRGRQKQQREVGRRSTMGNNRFWVLLIIIGGQPVILFADKRLKEFPGASGNEAGHKSVIRLKGLLLHRQVMAYPVSDQG